MPERIDLARVVKPLHLAAICAVLAPEPDEPGRAKACREVARVLKPGGTAIISDFKNTADYAGVFASCGLTVERLAANWLDTFPPLRIVKATKQLS